MKKNKKHHVSWSVTQKLVFALSILITFLLTFFGRQFLSIFNLSDAIVEDTIGGYVASMIGAVIGSALAVASAGIVSDRDAKKKEEFQKRTIASILLSDIQHHVQSLRLYLVRRVLDDEMNSDCINEIESELSSHVDENSFLTVNERLDLVSRLSSFSDEELSTEDINGIIDLYDMLTGTVNIARCQYIIRNEIIDVVRNTSDVYSDVNRAMNKLCELGEIVLATQKNQPIEYRSLMSKQFSNFSRIEYVSQCLDDYDDDIQCRNVRSMASIHIWKPISGYGRTLPSAFECKHFTYDGSKSEELDPYIRQVENEVASIADETRRRYADTSYVNNVLMHADIADLDGLYSTLQHTKVDEVLLEELKSLYAEIKNPDISIEYYEELRLIFYFMIVVIKLSEERASSSDPIIQAIHDIQLERRICEKRVLATVQKIKDICQCPQELLTKVDASCIDTLREIVGSIEERFVTSDGIFLKEQHEKNISHIVGLLNGDVDYTGMRTVFNVANFLCMYASVEDINQLKTNFVIRRGTSLWDLCLCYSIIADDLRIYSKDLMDVFTKYNLRDAGTEFHIYESINSLSSLKLDLRDLISRFDDRGVMESFFESVNRIGVICASLLMSIYVEYEVVMQLHHIICEGRFKIGGILKEVQFLLYAGLPDIEKLYNTHSELDKIVLEWGSKGSCITDTLRRIVDAD